MQDTSNQVSAILIELSNLIVRYGLDALGGIVIAIVGWYAAKGVRRLVLRALRRSNRVEETFMMTIANVARYTVIVLVGVLVLSQFGVQTASIIAALGVAGIAIALAMQGTLSNIAAGTMLLFLKPFRVGEYIDADGISGTIDELGLLTTQMRTSDGIYVMVPNNQLWNKAIKNYSRLPTRRLSLVIGISYDDDIEAALKVLEDLLDSDQRVLADPGPEVIVQELAESSVNISVRCWANSGDYWNLLCDLTKQSKQILAVAGFTIPFPQRDLHIIPPDALQTEQIRPS
jgi:small conductance mechanosensitive channel